MKTLTSTIAIVCTIFSMRGFSQDSLSNGNGLNIPFKKYGFSFGNSHTFNGIRFNFADKDVDRINGINLTLWKNKHRRIQAANATLVSPNL